MARRTDLALEEKELWEESAQETTELPGVLAREIQVNGVKTTVIRILDEQGEQALHKPKGRYLTMELTPLLNREAQGFQRTAEAVGGQLRRLLPDKPDATILVVGLGNEAITPDAVGPLVLKHLLITRHLVSQMPDFFGDYCSVAAVAPGVLGTTGLESAEVVRGVAERIKPDCLIVVDALASRSLDRVCTTLQLTDTGITPGSGIHNARDAFCREEFGVPVIAVGVPTVVDVETLVEDYGGSAFSPERLAALCGGQKMIVTPRDIDARIAQVSKLIAYGINLAVQKSLSVEDIAYFVE